MDDAKAGKGGHTPASSDDGEDSHAANLEGARMLALRATTRGGGTEGVGRGGLSGTSVGKLNSIAHISSYS